MEKIEIKKIRKKKEEEEDPIQLYVHVLVNPKLL